MSNVIKSLTILGIYLRPIYSGLAMILAFILYFILSLLSFLALFLARGLWWKSYYCYL